MANQRDIEQLLRDIPLSTPGQVSAAETMFGIFMSIRNTAFEGVLPEGVTMPGTGMVLNIPAIIDQMRSGNYADAALSLISMVGDAAGAYSFLINAGVEAGAISGLGATASSGVIAGMVGEAAGPAAIAAMVFVETARIPIGASENLAKLFYITDASGILTSWMFNMPAINPHERLTRQARTGGYNRTDISEHCRTAHERAQQLWRRNYQGNADARRRARAAAGDNWETHWLQVARALESRLAPVPTGVGASWARRIIRETRSRAATSARQARQVSLQAANRRAAGGEWIRMDGNDVFIPDR